MKEYTNQQWLDMGIRAQELLSNEIFSMAMKDVIDYHINSFLNSTPGDEKVREAAYFQANAIQQVLGVLQQWVTIKDNIVNNLENPVEE